MSRSPEAVILSAAKDLRLARERSFAALRMTNPASLAPFLKNHQRRGACGRPGISRVPSSNMLSPSVAFGVNSVKHLSAHRASSFVEFTLNKAHVLMKILVGNLA